MIIPPGFRAANTHALDSPLTLDAFHERNLHALV